MQDALEYAHEYFSEAESVESSTYRELLDVLRCLQSMMHLCADKFVVFQMDANNLLGIVNRGSPTLKLNALARELFRLGLEHRITLTVEWVPRKQNTLADELSKLLIPEDYILSRTFFLQLEDRWRCHSVDLFASNANNFARGFTPCIGSEGRGGVNGFAYKLGRGARLDPLLLPDGGSCVAKAAARRECSDYAHPVVGVGHVVVTCGAGRGSFC
jgi:hypothetical protein